MARAMKTVCRISGTRVKNDYSQEGTERRKRSEATASAKGLRPPEQQIERLGQLFP